jgi:hypothetical protein
MKSCIVCAVHVPLVIVVEAVNEISGAAVEVLREYGVIVVPPVGSAQPRY